jgi:SM-20-related protein
VIRTIAVADALAEAGWVRIPDFVPDAIWRALGEELQGWHAEGGLRAAGVGTGERRRIASDVRGDQIRWLESTSLSVAQQHALSCLEELRQTLNRELQLGLFEFEGHFALYPPGVGYRRHQDQHQGSDARALSCVMYLNSDWKAEDEGQLRLYPDQAGGAGYREVLPEGGSLVCFLSERFWHEVLPAHRERLSLTGWFRHRS